MRAYFFTETAYPYLPDEATYPSIRVSLPNRHYDPKIGAELYHQFLDEWAFADEMGWDLMVNEHHQTATNVNPAAPILLGVLARITRKARLLILGNPLANRRQPTRVAEEMATVDVLSRGRLEVGFVRGVPYEISAMNSMPVRTTQRFWEAHDLIIKAWTQHDGPFNFEGRYFHHREINIWPRPYQQPHPPVWIASTSPGSVPEIAEHGYVVATFMTGFDGTKTIFDSYRKRASELGRETNPDRLAYAVIAYVGDTDAQGYAGAEKLLWYMQSNKVSEQFANPPGYSTASAVAKAMRNGPRDRRHASLESLIEQGIVFAGNPETVVRQAKKLYQHVGGFGHLLVMGQAGFLNFEETIRSLRLFAKEVHPQLQELRYPS